jgi:hypothetical protein
MTITIKPDFSQQWEGAADEYGNPAKKPAVAAIPEAPPTSQELPENHDLDAEVAMINEKFPPINAAGGGGGGTKKEPTGTRFHQAGTPAPANEPEMGLGETFGRAAVNLIPSTVQALKATGSALVHLPSTLGAIKDLGVGAVSKAEGAFVPQDAQQKEKDEALLNSLVDHYKQVYGSSAGFKKAFANDPASILMDAATFAGGVGSIAKLGGLSRVAEIATAAASKLDPIAVSLKTAKSIAKAPVNVLRGATAATSGVPIYLQQMATKAGAAPKPLRDAYNRITSGAGDASETINAISDSVKARKAAAVADYIKQKGSLVNGNPDFAPVDQALADARSHTQMTGKNSSQFETANQALDKAEQFIQEYKNSTNPEARTLIGFDNLKQSIWDLRESTNNAVAQRHLSSLYNSIKDSIRKVDPAYDDLMEKYQTAMSGVSDARRTLIGGDKVGSTAALAKALRAVKNSSGVNMIEDLAQHDPRIPYMLAAHAVSPATAGVMRGIQDMVASALLGYHVNPLAGAAAMVASSPRIVGKVNYGVGRLGSLTGIAPVSRAVSSVASKIPVKPTYYAGRALEENQTLPNDSSSPDSVFSRMIGAESGGQHFNKNGSPKISSAGAVGIAQVRPSTGPEAAAAANLPYDEQKLYNDPEYNRKLGEAYFKKQLKAFGNPEMAAAAYNAGPDRVKQALDKARKFGGSYIDHLPAETRDYLKKVMASGGRIGRASGGRVDTGRREQLVNRLMTMAKSAKKLTDKTTEPLLNAPDDAVVKALDVAQQAI